MKAIYTSERRVLLDMSIKEASIVTAACAIVADEWDNGAKGFADYLHKAEAELTNLLRHLNGNTPDDNRSVL